MPSEQLHLRAARLKEQTGIALSDSPQTCSCAIVLAFYSALHWVDAYLARNLKHPQSHVEREDAIRHSPLQSIWDQYRTLSDRSEDARYRLKQFTQNQARSLFDAELAAIKSQVTRLLR